MRGADHGLSSRQRVEGALRRPANWHQLGKFCIVGTSGYAVNLVIYAGALATGVHYSVAAALSFLVAVSNNYVWNRVWTFKLHKGHGVFQGVRFFTVSLCALLANLVILDILVSVGMGQLAAQAIAIFCVTPVNFVGNRLWSFGRKSAGTPSLAAPRVAFAHDSVERVPPDG
jgi:putative flippase GtrA